MKYGRGADVSRALSMYFLPVAPTSSDLSDILPFIRRRDGCYCFRTWTFLGEEETRSISYSAEPMVKSHNVLRREPLDEVPDELRQIRGELAFDCRKFDYGIVDDRVVLYDVNRTPTLGKIAKEQLPRFHKLADGIRTFL